MSDTITYDATFTKKTPLTVGQKIVIRGMGNANQGQRGRMHSYVATVASSKRFKYPEGWLQEVVAEEGGSYVAVMNPDIEKHGASPTVFLVEVTTMDRGPWGDILHPRQKTYLLHRRFNTDAEAREAAEEAREDYQTVVEMHDAKRKQEGLEARELPPFHFVVTEHANVRLVPQSWVVTADTDSWLAMRQEQQEEREQEKQKIAAQAKMSESAFLFISEKIARNMAQLQPAPIWKLWAQQIQHLEIDANGELSMRGGATRRLEAELFLEAVMVQQD